jgi:dihydrofolate reductase
MLIYIAMTSLDLYINDESGGFEWARPSDEVHAFVNDLMRPAGTHLYGRRMYDTMAVWETLESDEPVMRDFAELWRGAEKVVYSTTLRKVTTAKTRLERRFDPAAIAALKASQDVAVGGPTLAAEAFRAGLVDECHLLLNPVSVGGGTPALPLNLKLSFSTLSSRRFENGVIYLHLRAI